jgi:type I restriction enzyme S subunit
MVKQTSKVPALRFPEFSGEWESKVMSNLGKFMGGGTPSTQQTNYWEGEIPWISSSDIDENSIQQIRINRFITDEAIKNSATKIIPTNSILMVSRVGVGKIAVSDRELCTSQDFTNLILQNDNAYFIAYLLKSDTSKLLSYSQGTSIKGFTNADIGTLKLYIPALTEQEKVADFLGAVDEKIQQLTRKKELLEQYKKGVMQRIFSQELRFKDDDGKEYPDWEEKRLDEIAPLQRGFDLPITTIEKGKYPVVFSNGILKFHNEFKVKAPGIVTGRSGTIGNIFFVEKDFWPHNTSLWVTNFHGNLPKFIYYLYQTFDIKKYSTGSGVPTLNRNEVHSLPLNIPTVSEQEKIADFLSALDEKIQLATTQLDKAKEFKKGLLQKMFV